VLVLIVGGMFSGKSTELQRQGKRHILRGDRVLFIKPRIDNRYSEDEIVTHDGNRVKAINVDLDEPIHQTLDLTGVDVVLIDEIQFFTEQVIESIDEMLKRGIRVYCSGLDLDFEGKPFEITAILMAKAEDVIKLHAVCEKCGGDAWVTPRRSKNNKERVSLGVHEYYPLCRKCFYELG
jgi:thymidine kinase